MGQWAPEPCCAKNRSRAMRACSHGVDPILPLPTSRVCWRWIQQSESCMLVLVDVGAAQDRPAHGARRGVAPWPLPRLVVIVFTRP